MRFDVVCFLATEVVQFRKLGKNEVLADICKPNFHLIQKTNHLSSLKRIPQNQPHYLIHNQ
jgi:hypothetical protein